MRLIVVIFWALVASGSIDAALINGDCSHPFLFADAKVNLIVLPYTNLAGESAELQAVSSQLTFVLQQTILYSASKYPSLGTVRMVPSSPDRASDCEATVIERRILGQLPGATQQLNAEGAVILLWGRIFKEGEDIYLSSYAKIVTRSEHFALQTTTRGHGVFVAKLPANAIPFSPRLVSTVLLQTIASSFEQFATVHGAPSSDSPAFAIPISPPQAVSYNLIQTTRNGWMNIQVGSGPSGWIFVGNLPQRESLAQKLPELRFIDGAIGYLNFTNATDQESVRALAQASLQFFSESVQGSDVKLAVGVAKSMLAAMFQQNAQLRLRGYQLAREMVALLPYNADARNFELVYRLGVFDGSIFAGGAWRGVAAELAQAAALGRGNRYILENLDSFYRAVLEIPGLIGQTDASEIRIRRDQVAALREAPSFPESPTKREKKFFAGIELGSKGTRGSLFSFLREIDGPDEQVIYTQTINTKLVSSMRNQEFTEEGIQDASAAVKFLVDEMKAAATTKGLGNVEYFVVGSNSVAKATNREILAGSVKSVTGLDIEFIDAQKEGYFGLVSIIPPARRTLSMYVDIGSGNTKLGCLTLSTDDSSFRSVEIPFGSVTGWKKASEKNPVDLGLGIQQLMRETVEPEYRKETNEVECLRNRQHLYWTGGAAWATATFTHPESALNAYVVITMRDLDNFLASLKNGSWNQQDLKYRFPVDLSPSEQKEIREKSERDRTDVLNIFVREDLLSGVSIMKTILESGNPTAVIRFARSEGELYGYAIQKFGQESGFGGDNR